MTPDEIANRYQIRRLAKGETIVSFDCGDDDLNDFIINESVQYRQARLAVTYVIEVKNTNRVIGFFSLANDRVSISDFESKTEFNRFRKKRFVNEKRLKSYPATKICRLGIDSSAKGQSLGTFILDFIKSYFVIDNKTGCRFITVDAYADAVPFYLKNNFLPLSSDSDTDHTKLLFFDLEEIEEAAIE
ncbi:MAG: GNAT family N-acetyltransferase [Muribaculaceae bacterium]|nr:GNAT family N-acetyltransferase [Muribaculaceae bacterium]